MLVVAADRALVDAPRIVLVLTILALITILVLILLLLLLLTFSSSSLAVFMKHAMARQIRKLETTARIKITRAVCAGLSVVDVATQITTVFLFTIGNNNLSSELSNFVLRFKNFLHGSDITLAA